MSKFSLNTLGKLLADKSGLSQVEAELFIRKMFDVCNQGLDADKQVKIKWLGTFKVQATKDRESINVNTGERFTIEGRDKLTFTPDNILKEIVNKPFAQFETVVVNDGVDFDEIDEKFGEEQTEDAPEQVIDFLDEEKTAKFLTMLSDLGHASPIEHASFTFGIEGVSRTLLAQITRHRIASFSVQSQRYVRLDDFRYVTPPEIEAIPEAKAAFLASMEEDAQRYLDLAHKLEEGHTARLMAEGMPEKQARAKASKQANEDARFVLPNACETKMVVTMNARSLMNFFQLRCCNRAQWEIRELAEKMFTLVYPVAPHIFAKAGPACLCGPCPEGKMCCGKTAEVRAKYAAIKEGAAV